MTWKSEIKKEDSSLPDSAKEAIDKVTEQLTSAFENIDHELLLSVIIPHGRGRELFKDKKELVDMLVKNTIKRLKSDILYR